jgi:hypothetical protein
MISLQTVETKESHRLAARCAAFPYIQIVPHVKRDASLFMKYVFTCPACYMPWELNGEAIFKCFTCRNVLRLIVFV